MSKSKLHSPSEYAKLKKVSPPRITQLKKRLKKKIFGSKWAVVDCPENDKLFENPHVNANRAK